MLIVWGGVVVCHGGRAKFEGWQRTWQEGESEQREARKGEDRKDVRDYESAQESGE